MLVHFYPWDLCQKNSSHSKLQLLGTPVIPRIQNSPSFHPSPIPNGHIMT